LVEPESGACFDNAVRLKFIWYRRLEGHERISIYVGSARDPAYAHWKAAEQDILDTGGAIHPIEDGYRFEVNFRLDDVPKGEAYWKVAIVHDLPPDVIHISPWSEERQMFKVPWPGKRLGCRPENSDM
jgi:hypothetical protein